MKNIFLIRNLGRLFFIYQRAVGKVKNIRVDSLETLEEVFDGFWKKRYRLILAFQHPSTVEPALWPAVLAREFRLSQQRRGRGILPFAHLVYDHRIPYWAGDYLNWLLPAVGAISIRRGLPDKEGINRIRERLLNGPWPVMMAPEGGRTWRQDRWAELEDGMGLLALWTYNDLKKSGQNADVRILPLRCFFRWPKDSRPIWRTVLKAWESRLGLDSIGQDHQRVARLFSHLAHRAGLGVEEGQSFDAFRTGLAFTILQQAGGKPEAAFLKELRYREGLLYLPYQKRLPPEVKKKTNLLGAAELLWFLDYPWEEDFCADLDRAWEVLENLKAFAEFLDLNDSIPPYPALLRDAELRTGRPFDLSQAPDIGKKAATLAWIRDQVQHDGY